MKLTKDHLFILILALFFSNAKTFCQYSNIEFVENKGQWDEKVKFRGAVNYGDFYLLQKGFRVVQSNPSDLQHLADVYHGHLKNTPAVKALPEDVKVTVHSHAYDVVFLNAQTPAVTGDKPLNTYNNYFLGNDAGKWKGNCRIFQAVVYYSMYPGIDVRYYTDKNNLKYDIIVHTNADLSQLMLKYIGAEDLKIKEGGLIVKTSVSETHELAPYAYQVINGIRKEVSCKFKTGGNVVKFDVGDYSKSATLVIDPTVVFSTFTGSSADNWGYTATYGTDGSFYAGGIVFGTGFPVNVGAFDQTYNGGQNDGEGIQGFDIGIMKFNRLGSNRVYATYIGGSNNEYPHSLVADAQGNLIIAGRTTSGDGYPHKVPAVGVGGNYDIVLTKLNAAGSDIIGSVRIGGANNDGVNVAPKYLNGSAEPAQSLRRNYGDDSRSEVILDNAGDVLLASNTQSTDFPVTSNAFQSNLAGAQDAVIIKASPDLSNIIFSTFFGGSANDAAFVLAINPLSTSNIYIGGNTESNNLPGDKSGVHQPAYSGGTDGFVTILSSDGSTIAKTSYFGTGGNDMLYGIQFDRFGFPYIMGTTTGSWTVMNAAFSQGGGKQFISKLKPDLSGYVYSTVFGTNSVSPNISPIAFLVDRCENVYVSGWGGNVNSGAGYPNSGTLGLSITSDATQSSTDNSDFYFFVLERNATKQLYGSFFGQNGGTGEHVDGGTSRFDREGVIYQALCANCGGGVPFPTTPGVWAPNNPSNNCNLAAVKIAFNLSGVAGSVKSSIAGSTNDTTGCIPLTVQFTDTLAQGVKYVWNFGDGSPEQTTNVATVNHTYNAVGDYTVMLISIDSAKCNIADTARTKIRVRTFKAFIDFASKKLLPCQELKYEFTNLSTVVPAARPFTDSSFLWNFGDGSTPVRGGMAPVIHSFPAPGTYKVILSLTDTNFCNAPVADTLLLRIAFNVDARFQTPQIGCAPYTASFIDISSGGHQYFWDFGDGGTSTDQNPKHTFIQPGIYKVLLRVVDSGTCNISDTVSVFVTVYDQPVAGFFYSPNPPEVNTPVDFTNSSTGATHYVWQFGDEEQIETETMASQRHLYNQTDTFRVCLIASNTTGCPDTVCKSLYARVFPLLDVPNAFTPNGDGNNDKIFVRGYGISKMLWRIYNRWGVMVFETKDRNEGWDGKYKGNDQPMEVYHYVLQVTFTDKTKYSKNGDITLLR